MAPRIAVVGSLNMDLLLQLETPLPTVSEAAAIAHAHGVLVILNPAPARSLPDELLRRVTVLIPNEGEAALLVGYPMKDGQEVQAAARLRRRGPETILITLGERGALLATKDGAEVVPPFTVSPTDTTAAGDAFVAGFAVSLAEGKELVPAVRRGNAAGALAATRPGAQPSLPTRAELEAFTNFA